MNALYFIVATYISLHKSHMHALGVDEMILKLLKLNKGTGFFFFLAIRIFKNVTYCISTLLRVKFCEFEFISIPLSFSLFFLLENIQ